MSEGLTIDAARRRFIDEGLGRSSATRRTYDYGLRVFLAFVERRYGLDVMTAPVTALSIEQVTAFLAAGMPEDVRTREQVARMRTLVTQLSAVRRWYAYLSAYDHHPHLSIEKLRLRLEGMLPRYTSPPPDIALGEIEGVVDYARGLPVGRTGARELRRLKTLALILFLYRSGVRVSELCGLRRRDVDLARGEAGIYRAKGGKSRTVLFDSETAAALAGYWRARGDAGRGVGTLPAFSARDVVGEAGRGIAIGSVEYIVRQLAEAAGVEARITPHSFRHALASELVRRRVRESTVQTLLGHASPLTTRIYVHQTAREIADEYQQAFGRYERPADDGG